MSNGHGSSRRQAYGRRMKDLRTRRGADVPVDLDGPTEWTRGGAWEDEQALHHAPRDRDHGNGSARPH
ncbi:MAG TPA: hypothetical protein VJZ50_10765 [Candidatus Limnocylindrales bacterium]|nr:hypothetical protein [Candidatus Limnocylindrales bacterium]